MIMCVKRLCGVVQGSIEGRYRGIRGFEGIFQYQHIEAWRGTLLLTTQTSAVLVVRLSGSLIWELSFLQKP